ncbi:MAG: hypothetical protein LBE01_06420, partial [Deltaproteobacteria bacterium]|nr:hypothetical protein [Deltaproteobacteria bacterium]
PRLNAAAFDDKEKRLADLKEDLNERRLEFQSQRSSCLIFSKEDASSENFDYLNGCWESRPGGFINAYSGQSAAFGFCYASSTGKATMSVKGESDREGCSAPAQAAYLEEALTLTAQASVACGDGQADGFPRYSLRCVYSPKGAQAACELTQFDEYSSVFPIEFRRMS